MLAVILIVAAVAVGTIVVTGGNNTVEGFGKDMKHSGQKIEKNAE